MSREAAGDLLAILPIEGERARAHRSIRLAVTAWSCRRLELSTLIVMIGWARLAIGAIDARQSRLSLMEPNAPARIGFASV